MGQWEYNPSTGKSTEVGLSPGQSSGTVGGTYVERPENVPTSEVYDPRVASTSMKIEGGAVRRGGQVTTVRRDKYGNIIDVSSSGPRGSYSSGSNAPVPEYVERDVADIEAGYQNRDYYRQVAEQQRVAREAVNAVARPPFNLEEIKRQQQVRDWRRTVGNPFEFENRYQKAVKATVPPKKPLYKSEPEGGIFTGIHEGTRAGFKTVEEYVKLPRTGTGADVVIGGIEMYAQGVASLPLLPFAGVSLGKAWSEDVEPGYGIPRRAKKDVMAGAGLLAEGFAEKPAESIIALGIGAGGPKLSRMKVKAPSFKSTSKIMNDILGPAQSYKASTKSLSYKVLKATPSPKSIIGEPLVIPRPKGAQYDILKPPAEKPKSYIGEQTERYAAAIERGNRLRQTFTGQESFGSRGYRPTGTPKPPNIFTEAIKSTQQKKGGALPGLLILPGRDVPNTRALYVGELQRARAEVKPIAVVKTETRQRGYVIPELQALQTASEFKTRVAVKKATIPKTAFAVMPALKTVYDVKAIPKTHTKAMTKSLTSFATGTKLKVKPQTQTWTQQATKLRTTTTLDLKIAPRIKIKPYPATMPQTATSTKALTRVKTQQLKKYKPVLLTKKRPKISKEMKKFSKTLRAWKVRNPMIGLKDL